MEAGEIKRAEQRRCSAMTLAVSALPPLLTLYCLYLPGNSVLDTFKEIIWSNPMIWIAMICLVALNFVWASWSYGVLPFRIRQTSISRCRLTAVYLAISSAALLMSWLIAAGWAMLTIPDPLAAILGHVLWISGGVLIAAIGGFQTYFGRTARA